VKVGILGAGQLGQMLALAGRRLGIDSRLLSPDPQAPAGQYAELVVAGYDNEAALAHFAEGLDVVTYEFESIPAKAVEFFEGKIPVRPPSLALRTAQDRLEEKKLFARVGIPTPRHVAIDGTGDVRSAGQQIAFPALLKTRRQGYDGKGQIRVDSRFDLERGWVSLGAVPSILEEIVRFDRELSLIAVRAQDGDVEFYPLVENYHSEGMLRFSFAPAPRIDPEKMELARRFTRQLMDDLDYVGVMAVEMFEKGDELIANEIAPRVHNSGHWTIEGADTSQFENHLRAITGMELGSTEPCGVSGMVNVIGREPDVSRLREIPGVHVHMYGKTAAPRRKLGHITVTADDGEGMRSAIAQVRAVLAR
jgi:5-(carboxyamino)imidazole ribonucleotide synthase